jgi:hypothetical protein
MLLTTRGMVAGDAEAGVVVSKESKEAEEEY